MKTTQPEWIKKAIRNRKQREKYFLKRYGSLSRMYEIDARLQQYLNDESMRIEIEDCQL